MEQTKRFLGVLVACAVLVCVAFGQSKSTTRSVTVRNGIAEWTLYVTQKGSPKRLSYSLGVKNVSDDSRGLVVWTLQGFYEVRLSYRVGQDVCYVTNLREWRQHASDGLLRVLLGPHILWPGEELRFPVAPYTKSGEIRNIGPATRVDVVNYDIPKADSLTGSLAELYKNGGDNFIEIATVPKGLLIELQSGAKASKSTAKWKGGKRHAT